MILYRLASIAVGTDLDRGFSTSNIGFLIRQTAAPCEAKTVCSHRPP
jgi:hypothetical protein